MPKLNLGYDQFGCWSATQEFPFEINFGGFFKGHVTELEMAIKVSPDGRSLDADITKFTVVREQPDGYGWGFLDFQAFCWWDPQKCRTFWPEVYFPNHDDFHADTYRKALAWPIIKREIDRCLSMQDPGNIGFWDLTWFWCWQFNLNVPDNYDTMPLEETLAKGHYHWDLTEDDFDENGGLKDRILFWSYVRHSDAAGVHEATENSAHWSKAAEFRLSNADFNWKYHPFQIRKSSQWYSCNRIGGQDGYDGTYGDGHVGIKKGDTVNAVWNDDFAYKDTEAFYDQDLDPNDPFDEPGPQVTCPRVGIGRSPFRPKQMVHELEEQ